MSFNLIWRNVPWSRLCPQQKNTQSNHQRDLSQPPPATSLYLKMFVVVKLPPMQNCDIIHIRVPLKCPVLTELVLPGLVVPGDMQSFKNDTPMSVCATEAFVSGKTLWKEPNFTNCRHRAFVLVCTGLTSFAIMRSYHRSSGILVLYEQGKRRMKWDNLSRFCRHCELSLRDSEKW